MAKNLNSKKLAKFKLSRKTQLSAVYGTNTLNDDVEIKYRIGTEASKEPIIRRQIVQQSIPRDECRQ